MGERVLMSIAAQSDSDFEYLQAELTRIELLIHREIACRQRNGQDPGDAFRGLYLVEDEIRQLLTRPFAGNGGQTVALAPEDAQAFSQAETQARQQAHTLSKAARQRGRIPRLEALAAAFHLDRFELDALLICLAPALDLRYERLYAFLQDDVTRKRPTVNLILDLLGDGKPAHRLLLLQKFGDDAPLFKHRFLERVPDPTAHHTPLLGQALGLDPALVTWLLGGYQPHASLKPYADLWWPAENDRTNSVLAADVRPDLERALTLDHPVLVFFGVDQVGQRAAARLIAQETGRPVLHTALASVVGQGISSLEALQLALRDARLTGAIPFLSGWDECLLTATPRESGPERGTPDGSPSPELLSELWAYPDWIIISGRAAWQVSGMDRDRAAIRFEFPTPAYPQRKALWRHFLGPDLSGEWDVEALAGQFALTTGQIRDAVASARDQATWRGDAVCTNDLLAAARAHSNPRLSSLARKITPRFTWDDIVLPDDQRALLQEIVATVRQRSLVLEAWGVGRKLASSPGVTMLFSGEPGTGKTMAAEVMAHELGLDLYKIDLSTVVSKYIGETEKNLEKIFGEAQSSNAILFFDEADAIFGKRSEVKDAHDRYANIEISYLLQRMEAYEGVTILATNLRANLDEAFTRRLQFAVDFPFPDEQYRARIWKTLFPMDVPHNPDIDLNLLARRFRLAGGNIRNILVSAAYLAASDSGRMDMNHLLHGTRRELQKMGRLVNEQDLVP